MCIAFENLDFFLPCPSLSHFIHLSLPFSLIRSSFSGSVSSQNLPALVLRPIIVLPYSSLLTAHHSLPIHPLIVLSVFSSFYGQWCKPCTGRNGSGEGGCRLLGIKRRALFEKYTLRGKIVITKSLTFQLRV